MARTIEDIQKDYANAAYELGHLSFQLRESEAELERLDQEARKRQDKMKHLNKEALKLQNDARLAKVAEEKSSEPTEAA